jgi:hypothetical protein
LVLTTVHSKRSTMKNLLFLCFAAIIATSASAQPAGPQSGNTFTIVAIPGSNQTWLNPGNVGASDNIYATFPIITGPVGSYTDYIVATNFGFNIPPTATIQGIVVQVEESDPKNRTSDYLVQIVQGGVIGTANRATGTPYPLTDTYESYGYAGDLWGENWTPADINSPDFGVAIAAQRDIALGKTAGQIDNIRITVFYSFTTLPVKLTSFSALKNNDFVSLKWSTADEVNMNRYETERSADGRNFSFLSSIAARNQSSSNNYSSDDRNPLRGISYYRLKTIDNSGEVTYSKIVSVQFSTGPIISLYPNPLQKGNQLFITNPNQDLLTIQFINAGGQVSGTVITSSNIVPANVLATGKGINWYRVYDSNHLLVSSGILLNP